MAEGAGVAGHSGGLDKLFDRAETRAAGRLQVLGLRPDPLPEVVQALSRPHIMRTLLLDDSPEHAVAVHRLVTAASIRNVDVMCADLFAAGSYEGRVPADVIGVGERMTTAPEAHLRVLVEALPRLCSRDAVVIWRLTDLTSRRYLAMRRMLGRAGFDSDDPGGDSGWHYARFVGIPMRLEGPRL